MKLSKHKRVIFLSVIAGLLLLFVSSPTIKAQAQGSEESSGYFEDERGEYENPIADGESGELPPPPDPPENIDEPDETSSESPQLPPELSAEEPSESSSNDEFSSSSSQYSTTPSSASSSRPSSGSNDETPEVTTYEPSFLGTRPPSQRVESGEVNVGTLSRRQVATFVLRMAEKQSYALNIISKMLVAADFVPAYLSSLLIPLSQIYGVIFFGINF